MIGYSCATFAQEQCFVLSKESISLSYRNDRSLPCRYFYSTLPQWSPNKQIISYCPNSHLYQRYTKSIRQIDNSELGTTLGTRKIFFSKIPPAGSDSHITSRLLIFHLQHLCTRQKCVNTQKKLIELANFDISSLNICLSHKKALPLQRIM